MRKSERKNEKYICYHHVCNDDVGNGDGTC